MKRRKISLIILIISVFCFSLGACFNKNNNTGNKDVDIAYSESGSYANTVNAKNYVAHRADERVEAYSVYTVDGKSLGNFKTLASAINKAVSNDAETQNFGSYVTKKDQTKKMFVNRKGFTDSNDECFWYYENGTSLDAFDCWNSIDSLKMLQNSNYVVHKTMNFGTKSVQGWNGYKVLDYKGDVSNDTSAQYYELSSTMDASVLQFTKRLSGITALDYTIDLSNVKITPAYDGNKVYAFIGFYAWQDWYVLVNGIACDVNTGNWYVFEATSRDNSFSDAQYNLGECVMTSTWNDKGYFVPDGKELNLKIETKKLEDEEGVYQEDRLEFAVKDGATYRRALTNSLINEKFGGHSLGMENSYVFVAGLDIVNQITQGVNTENTDYFNGAKFENLTVKSATAYVPTVEEISDVDYTFQIDEEWRGKKHDLVLANDVYTEGVIDYTILNSGAFVTYNKLNGTDVYSFSYDKAPISENVLGEKLKAYQDQIDELALVTEENASQYESKIKTIGGWYGANAEGVNSTLHQQYRNVLDFENYLKAKQILEDVYEVTEEAQKVIDEYKKLSQLATYNFKAWQAPEGEAMTGYMYTEVEFFRTVKAKYDALPSENERKSVLSHIDAEEFAMYDDLSKVLADSKYQNVVINAEDESGTTKVTYNGIDALKQIFYWSYRIKAGSTWGANENDGDNAGKINVMDSDNNWKPSSYVLYMVHELEDRKLELPELAYQLLNSIKNEQLNNDVDYLYHVLKLASQIESGEVTYINEEVAEVVNTYMKGFTNFEEAGLNWNYASSGTSNVPNIEGKRDFPWRAKSYKTYFGLDANVSLQEYVKFVTDFLKENGYIGELTSSGLGLVDEVKVLKMELTSAAQNVIDQLNAISSNDVEAFTNIIEGAYANLTAGEKLAVRTNVDFSKFDSTTTFEDGLKNIETKFETYATLMGNETALFTAVEAYEQLLTWTNKIAKGSTFVYGTENDGDNANGTKVMDGDNTFYPSMRVVACVEYFKSINVELPNEVKGVLEAIGYNSFYNEFYYPFYNTVKLVMRIEKDSVTTLNGLTEQELSFLNEVWTNDYVIGNQISWNWNDGNKMATYYSVRSARIIAVAGGDTQKTIAQYYETVATFLTNLGYTVKANGWGVTATEIK